MIDLLVQLMRLPRRLQKLIAAMLGAFVAAFIVFSGVTLFSMITERMLGIEGLQDELVQKQVMIEAANNLPRSAGAASETDINYQGSGKPAIQAAIQSAVSALVAANGAAVQSTAAMESPNSGMTSVSLTMSGSNLSIVRTLAAIEGAQPALLLRELTLTVADQKRDQIYAQATIDGFLPAKVAP